MLNLITVEGGIGAGKSSAMAALRKERPSLCYVDEPVETWERYGLLEHMYNKTIPAATFQLAALATRMAPLLTAVRKGERLIVSERCPYSDYAVFTKVNLDKEVDLIAYRMAYEALLTAMPEKVNLHIIYLKAGIDVLEARMKERDRPAERVGSAERAAERHAYLEKLQTHHDSFFCKTAEELGVNSVTRHVVDASLSAAQVAQRVKEVLTEVAPVKPEAEGEAGEKRARV